VIFVKTSLRSYYPPLLSTGAVICHTLLCAFIAGYLLSLLLDERFN